MPKIYTSQIVNC